MPSDDLVERRFNVDHPDQLWVADITEHPTAEGKIYLAAVLDAFSRRVVGWSIADHLRTELVVDALDMALWRRRPRPGTGLVHHSDHGAQYTSWAFGQRLRAAGLLGSMGTVGDALDNAVVESFFGTLQLELLDRQRWQSRRQLAQAIFEYIEAFYNPERRHSTIEYLSPIDYETRHPHQGRGMINKPKRSGKPGEPQGNPVNYNDPSGHCTKNGRLINGYDRTPCAELPVFTFGTPDPGRWQTGMTKHDPSWVDPQHGSAALDWVIALGKTPLDEFIADGLQAAEYGDCDRLGVDDGLCLKLDTDDLGCSFSLAPSQFHAACVKHDLMYRAFKYAEDSTGNDVWSDESQGIADRALLRDALSICAGPDSFPGCENAAFTAFNGVQTFGHDGARDGWLWNFDNLLKSLLSALTPPTPGVPGLIED